MQIIINLGNGNTFQALIYFLVFIHLSMNIYCIFIRLFFVLHQQLRGENQSSVSVGLSIC